MDKALEQALLFDFYGELLTEHQREVFQMHYLDDFSLGEISEEKAITRQAIFDLLKRSEGTLHKYEAKLGLVRRFVDMRAQIEQLGQLTTSLEVALSQIEALPETHKKTAHQIKTIVESLNGKI